MSDLSAWDLFVTAATPVVQLALLASVGALLAHKGTLDQAGCQVVAKLCFYVFTPALTFAKLAQAISVESVKHFWPLLANMTVSIAVGLLVGWAVAALLRTPRQFRPHALAAIAFGNVGNLPLVFVGPLCSDRRAVFYRALGEDCEHVSIAYIAFDIAVATILQFSIAVNLFRRKAVPLPSTPLSLGGGSLDSDEDDLQNQGHLAKNPTLSDLLAGREAKPGGEQQQQQQHWQGRQQQQQQEGDGEGLGAPARPASLAEPSTWCSPTAGGQGAARDDTWGGRGPYNQLLGGSRVGEQPASLIAPSVVELQLQPRGGLGATAADSAHLSAGLSRHYSPFHPQASPFQQGTLRLLGSPSMGRAAAGEPAGHQSLQLGHGSGGSASGSGVEGAGTQRPQQESWWEEDAAGLEDSDSTWLLGARHEQQGSGEPQRGVKDAGPSQLPPLAVGKGQLEGGSWRLRMLARVAHLWRRLRRLDWQSIVPLPTQASLLGTVVGCIPALKGLLYGPRPALGPLAGALNTLGQGLIPATIPLLGAILYKGPGQSTLPWRVTAGVLLTRLVLQPALLTGLVVLCLRLKLFVSPDPVFLFTILLSNTTPTAINMQTMTVLYNNHPSEMSSILFFSYLASLVTLPAFIWWFLRIIDTYQPGM